MARGKMITIDDYEDIISNPELVWKILTSKIKILGPWKPNKSIQGNWTGQGICRFPPSGANLGHYANVSRSMKLTAPDVWDYYNWGGVDDESFELDKIKYQEEIARWKEWSWEYRCYNKSAFRYTDTEELAINEVEKLLKEKGYLLVNDLSFLKKHNKVISEELDGEEF